MDFRNPAEVPGVRRCTLPVDTHTHTHTHTHIYRAHSVQSTIESKRKFGSVRASYGQRVARYVATVVQPKRESR